MIFYNFHQFHITYTHLVNIKKAPLHFDVWGVRAYLKKPCGVLGLRSDRLSFFVKIYGLYGTARNSVIDGGQIAGFYGHFICLDGFQI